MAKIKTIKSIKTKEEAYKDAEKIMAKVKSEFPPGTGKIFKDHDKDESSVDFCSPRSKGIDFVYLFDKINVFLKPLNK